MVLGGVPGPGGCAWSQEGGGGDPPGWLLLLAVRILLECILFRTNNVKIILILHLLDLLSIKLKDNWNPKLHTHK